MIASSSTPVERAERRLRRLFPDDPALTGATAWASEVLSTAGLEARKAPLRSVRALRRGEPRLDAAAARYLVESVAGRRPSSDRGGPSPLLD